MFSYSYACHTTQNSATFSPKGYWHDKAAGFTVFMLTTELFDKVASDGSYRSTDAIVKERCLLIICYQMQNSCTFLGRESMGFSQMVKWEVT